MVDDSSYFYDRPKFPKDVIRDGAKWLLIPSKTVLDSYNCVWPEKQNIVSVTVHILIISSYAFASYGQLYCVFDPKSDFGTVSYALSLFLVSIETGMRRILCYYYRKRLTAILDKIYNEFWPSRALGEETHKDVLNGSNYVFRFWSSYNFSGFLCCSQYIVVPLFRKQLPLQTTFPFDWQSSPLYEIFYFWQSLHALEIGFNICGVDLFFVSILYNFVAQFKLLKAYLAIKFTEVNEANKTAFKSKLKDPRDIIVSTINRHNYLIGMCKELDDIFSYYILIQYVASMGTLCLSAYVAVVMPGNVGVTMAYFFGHLGELAIYCYVGNEILLESGNLQNAAYECGWHLYDTSQDMKKSLINIMARCMKPVRMTAGGFGYLSLSSFMKLVQFSFSLFTLLLSMSKQK